MYPIILHYIYICIIETTVCNFSNDTNIQLLSIYYNSYNYPLLAARFDQ